MPRERHGDGKYVQSAATIYQLPTHHGKVVLTTGTTLVWKRKRGARLPAGVLRPSMESGGEGALDIGFPEELVERTTKVGARNQSDVGGGGHGGKERGDDGHGRRDAARLLPQ